MDRDLLFSLFLLPCVPRHGCRPSNQLIAPPPTSKLRTRVGFVLGTQIPIETAMGRSHHSMLAGERSASHGMPGYASSCYHRCLCEPLKVFGPVAFSNTDCFGLDRHDPACLIVWIIYLTSHERSREVDFAPDVFRGFYVQEGGHIRRSLFSFSDNV